MLGQRLQVSHQHFHHQHTITTVVIIRKVKSIPNKLISVMLLMKALIFQTILVVQVTIPILVLSPAVDSLPSGWITVTDLDEMFLLVNTRRIFEVIALILKKF